MYKLIDGVDVKITEDENRSLGYRFPLGLSEGGIFIRGNGEGDYGRYTLTLYLIDYLFYETPSPYNFWESQSLTYEVNDEETVFRIKKCTSKCNGLNQELEALEKEFEDTSSDYEFTFDSYKKEVLNYLLKDLPIMGYRLECILLSIINVVIEDSEETKKWLKENDDFWKKINSQSKKL